LRCRGLCCCCCGLKQRQRATVVGGLVARRRRLTHDGAQRGSLPPPRTPQIQTESRRSFTFQHFSACRVTFHCRSEMRWRRDVGASTPSALEPQPPQLEPTLCFLLIRSTSCLESRVPRPVSLFRSARPTALHSGVQRKAQPFTAGCGQCVRRWLSCCTFRSTPQLPPSAGPRTPPAHVTVTR
jgi:hypothetical protein